MTYACSWLAWQTYMALQRIFIGKFRVKLSTQKGKEELNKIQAKWVPQARTITRSIVNQNIEKS